MSHKLEQPVAITDITKLADQESTATKAIKYYRDSLERGMAEENAYHFAISIVQDDNTHYRQG